MYKKRLTPIGLYLLILLATTLAGCQDFNPEVSPLNIISPPNQEEPVSTLPPVSPAIIYPVTRGTCGGYKYGDVTSGGNPHHNGLDVGSGKGGEET